MLEYFGFSLWWCPLLYVCRLWLQRVHITETEIKMFFLVPWTEVRLQKLLLKKKKRKCLSIFQVSTISPAARIFQELLFFGVFQIYLFFPEPIHRSSTISSLPFKAIITSFQNASVLEHSQGTSQRVHFLTSHTSFCPCGNGLQALNYISDRKQVTFILLPPF